MMMMIMLTAGVLEIKQSYIAILKGTGPFDTLSIYLFAYKTKNNKKKIFFFCTY